MSTDASTDSDAPTIKSDFIREAVAADQASGRFSTIRTRFPPEPNGFLHIGHAKAICISFQIAKEFGGETNLRFDDTNPTKEEQRYIDAIQEDMAWLGFEPNRICYASDYFPQLYEWARDLIKRGLAYVDDQTAEEIRIGRGSLNTPGTPSSFRDRPVEESLDLFARMKTGEFEEGSRVLRAKIDMASPNLNLRDPAMYRILKAHHPRTGDAWCIYPMYDFAHGQSDSLEEISHSLCSIEFEDHRPLYEWFIQQLGIFPSRQMEFSRLNLTHVMTSKRKLRALVDEKIVEGWDDPRMPTLSGMRRRGYTAESIKALVAEVGITKFVGTTDYQLLDHHLRQDLNARAERRMAVLNPVKLVIENWPSPDHVEMRPAVNNPEDEAAGKREVPLTGEIYIEREDFMIDPPKKFFRLGPGREVRLRYGCYITCTGYETDDEGEVTMIKCTWDPESLGGETPDGRKIKGTIHWVSASHGVPAEVRLYQHLFATSDPNEGAGDRDEAGRDWRENIDPDSMTICSTAIVEPALAASEPSEMPSKTAVDAVQFERIGYFARDHQAVATTGDGRPVFNRTVTLRESKGKSR